MLVTRPGGGGGELGGRVGGGVIRASCQWVLLNTGMALYLNELE